MIQKAHILAFDFLGNRRSRIDDCFDLEHTNATPLYPLFKMKLSNERGAFEWHLNVGLLDPLRLTWNSVFRGTGIATIYLGDIAASLGIYLDGTNARTEQVVIESVRDGLGKSPAGTFAQAFVSMLSDPRRPLIGAIRFKPAEDPDMLSFVSSIEKSLAVAFFERPPAMAFEPEVTPASA